jgi:hypothetical protein
VLGGREVSAAGPALRRSGARAAAATALALSLAITSFGVPLGAKSPNQFEPASSRV